MYIHAHTHAGERENGVTFSMTDETIYVIFPNHKYTGMGNLKRLMKNILLFYSIQCSLSFVLFLLHLGANKEGFEVQKYTAQKREGSPKREKIEIITIENHGKQG